MWRKLKPLPFAVRGLTAVALDDGRIYLAGGYKTDPEGFTDDALIYDVKSDSYSPARPLPYAAMVGLVALDGFVYCIGGEDKQKHRTDKFFRVRVDELTRSSRREEASEVLRAQGLRCLVTSAATNRRRRHAMLRITSPCTRHRPADSRR